jgi:hypothetical protein
MVELIRQPARPGFIAARGNSIKPRLLVLLRHLMHAVLHLLLIELLVHHLHLRL